MTIELTRDNFDSLSKEGLVFIDFWAPWCGPCKQISSSIDEIATEFQEKALVAKVNIDQDPDLAMSFNIRSIPTVIILKDGNLVESLVGARDKEDYVSKLKSYLS